MVSDHMPRIGAFREKVGAWLREGKIVHRETVVGGLEHASEAFIAMLSGEIVGKMLVRLA